MQKTTHKAPAPSSSLGQARQNDHIGQARRLYDLTWHTRTPQTKKQRTTAAAFLTGAFPGDWAASFWYLRHRSTWLELATIHVFLAQPCTSSSSSYHWAASGEPSAGEPSNFGGSAAAGAAGAAGSSGVSEASAPLGDPGSPASVSVAVSPHRQRKDFCPGYLAVEYSGSWIFVGLE